MSKTETVLIAGASRGLGLAFADEWCRRGWRVVATTFGPGDGLQALQRAYPDQLQIEPLDVRSVAAMRALRQRLAHERFGVLLYNAGVALSDGETPLSAPEEDAIEMLRVNSLGPLRFFEIFSDLVPRGGVIAALSSDLGSIALNNGRRPLYSASKAALNMLMKSHAVRAGDDGLAKLLLAPGWIRTAMGGPDAPLSVDEAIPQVVDTVLANRGRTGLRFVDRFDRDVAW